MEFTQQIILGIIQGIVEWLPFSSEGFMLFVQTNFFKQTDISLFIKQALFLHLGTFFAALIYFRKDVKELFQGLFDYKKADIGTKRTLNFLIVATIISGFVGLAFLQFIKFIDTQFLLTSKIITFIIGALLLISGFLQVRASSIGIRTIYHLNNIDSVFLGFTQGLAALPGFSRSGLTISALLFRNIKETTALKLSFILSLPIVLIGNIILNLRDFTLITGLFWGLLTSFVFGLATIHILMKLAQKIKFGWFVVLMAILVIASSFL